MKKNMLFVTIGIVVALVAAMACGASATATPPPTATTAAPAAGETPAAVPTAAPTATTAAAAITPPAGAGRLRVVAALDREVNDPYMAAIDAWIQAGSVFEGLVEEAPDLPSEGLLLGHVVEVHQ